MKKKLALLLAGVLLVGTLGGCGAASTNDTGADVKETDRQTEADREGTKPAESQQASGETVELIWYVAGNGPQADTQAVLDEANKYLLEKLNCTLKIVETDFGSYDQKMQMVIASQEEFDLCYTAHWSNNFYNNINKNAFLELDDLLNQYAPDLKTLIPQEGWDAAKVKGNIYGVPNMQIWAMTNAVMLVKEYVDKYNFDTTSVKGLKDLEPLLEAIKADNPGMYPFACNKGGMLDFLTFNMGYDELAGRHIPGVVMLDDQDLKVINQFELPQVMEHYKMMYEWNKKGYIRQDAATLNDSNMEMKSGLHAASLTGTLKPGLDVIAKELFGGRDVINVPLSDSWLPTTGITATMTAISRTSKHPEKAMEFLNLFNTDPYIYNLITQGIEGKHYEKIDDIYIRPIENSGYAPNADWMYGNQFLVYLKEGQGKDDWADTIELNKIAKPTPALGFVFDPTNVQNEIASVSAVVKEYELSLDTGSVNPEKTMPVFLEKLKQAGSQVIIDEVQKQIDEWKAAK